MEKIDKHVNSLATSLTVLVLNWAKVVLKFVLLISKLEAEDTADHQIIFPVDSDEIANPDMARFIKSFLAAVFKTM